jgi:hypothetical protein
MAEDEFILEESKSGEYELIPEDTILEAKITSAKVITTKMIDEGTGEPVKQVEFIFVVQDEGDYQGRKLYGKTSTKFTSHEKCRLHAWVLEIMAIDELPIGFKLSLPALVGNLCRIVVTVNEWEDKKTGEKKSNNPVKDVIRSRSASRKVAPAEEPF